MDDEATGARVTSAESIAGILRRRAASGGLWVPLEGVSMLPTIEAPAEGLVGDLRRPRWGEVWAFVSDDGAVIVHRVLGCDRSGMWLMRGDGAARTDRAVAPGRLIGPVFLLRRDAVTHALRRSRAMAVRLHLRRVAGLLRWRVTQCRPGR